MRRIRYCVAMSLDGFIAGPHGEFDWIVDDPEIDLESLMRSFDTLLMGRVTYDVARSIPGGGLPPGLDVVVVSRTLVPDEHAGVTILSDQVDEQVRALRDRPGKDIWLFGGGQLFRSLLQARLVDTVEVAVVPILLGQGIQLLPGSDERVPLRFLRSRTYAASGITTLDYEVAFDGA